MRSVFAQAKSLISLTARIFLDEYRAVFPVNVTSPLDQSQAQWKPNVQPDRMGDDLGWEPAAFEADGLDHAIPSTRLAFSRVDVTSSSCHTAS